MSAEKSPPSSKNVVTIELPDKLVTELVLIGKKQNKSVRQLIREALAKIACKSTTVSGEQIGGAQ